MEWNPRAHPRRVPLSCCAAELLISRLRRREIRLHALLLTLRRCHCLLQSLHHIHDLLHGQVFALSARRTLPCGPHLLWFQELLLVVVQLQGMKKALGTRTQTNTIKQQTKPKAIGETAPISQRTVDLGKISKELNRKLQLEN